MVTDFCERLGNDVLIRNVPVQTFLVEDYGKPMEQHLSEWILNHPKEFQDALRRSYAAGADIGQTATQASSRFRAAPFGKAIADRVYEFNFKSAVLAKKVTPEDHYVIGDISTSNPDFLEPVGNMTYKEVYEGYLEQIKGLVEGGVDVLRIVGNHLEESVIAIRVARDNYPDIPVVASNVFFAGRKGFRTMMGLTPQAASSRLQEAGADVIGFNCGLMTKSKHTADWYPAAIELLKEVREGTDRYLWIAPDAGLAQLIDGKTVYPASPDEMAKEVLNWVDIGARVVGGCCGTSLEHVRKISDVIKKAKNL
jgi:5-methyltetrahydrofolate--homocysteine methyltransferase